MKIGTRLTLLLASPILLVIILFGWLTERRSQALLQEEFARGGRSVARIAQLAMEDYVRDHRIDDARELVDEISGYEHILGFRLFHQDGSLIYQTFPPVGMPPIDQEAVARVLRTRAPIETRTVVDNQPLISFIIPLSSSSKELRGAVQMIELESFLDKAALSSRRSVAALTGAMLLTAASVILLVTRFTVKGPIEDLVKKVRDVGSGDLGARVPIRRNDEIGRLAGEFNQMCERLAASQRALLEEQEERHRVETGLRRAERLASVGRLAAGLAHEIGTPLNIIGGRAESLLRKAPGDEAARRNLEIIITQIGRIAHIVRGMLDFARAREPHKTPTRVTQVVDRVLDLMEIQIEKQGIRVETNLTDDLPLVMADADQLHQVFLNLTTNALQAMPSGGRLTIQARLEGRPAADGGGDFLDIQFEDTGDGIPEAHLGRIFDPFFSTKDIGEGTGLGLSVSYGIVREHGGWIDVASEVGRGTRMSVYLPVAEASAAEAA